MSSGPTLPYSANHIEISTLFKDPGIDEFVFPSRLVRRWFPRRAVRREIRPEDIVRSSCRSGSACVEVEVVFLDVFAVISLVASEAEQPLLQDGIAAIPQGQCKAQILMAVGDAGQTILVPSVGPRAGMIVREVVPRVAIGAIVLADRAPCALGNKRSPPVPVALLSVGSLQDESLRWCRIYSCEVV